MRSDNNISVQAVLKRFALIYLPIVMVLSIVLLSGIRLDEQRLDGEIKWRENNRIEIAKGLVTQDLAAVDADLRLIANLPVLNGYLDSGNLAQREELEKLLLALVREPQRYDQVRYLDASGQEVIRINYNNGKPAIVPHEQLQNKSGRYYFYDTFKLNQGETFVSPLDLNIEHGSLEIPYKPMIRFGTPVFDSAGNKKGIIMLNYFGNELLQHFHDAMQGDDLHSSMLLNRDGYWLSGAKHEDEWGFMLGKNERTFGHDFPEAWRALSAAEHGALLTDQGLFVYTTVYPLLLGQHSSTGSSLAHALNQRELAAHEYHWKIVSFVPHAGLSGTAFYNQTSVRIALVVVYLLLALGAWLIAFVTLSRKQARDELVESKARSAAMEQASRVKDEFLAAISHELKTPLNHILGFADLLKEGLAGELNAEQKSMAQDIFDAGSKQLAIVNDLIELARLQAGKMKLQAEPQDPAKLLGEIAARHAAKAQAAGLAFAVEVAQGLGEMPLDREVVTHLLDQLLENAFKFTPSGGKISLTARRVPRTGVAAPVRIEAGDILSWLSPTMAPALRRKSCPGCFSHSCRATDVSPAAIKAPASA